MLSCHNITCRRGERDLFNGLEFTVPQGSSLIIKGPNGCGKTSLLKIVTGLLPPRIGEICWQNRRINEDYNRYKSIFCYVGHHNALAPHLTVTENIQYWSDLFDSHSRIAIAVNDLELRSILDIPTYQLSRGWQRRLALSRLLLSNRALWLLDEPLAHLDENTSALFCTVLDQHCRSGGMAVITSHKEISLDKAEILEIPTQ